MTERCWEELRFAGQAITEGLDISLAVKGLIYHFDLPRSPEAEAVRVLLNGLLSSITQEDLLAADASLAKAAE